MDIGDVTIRDHVGAGETLRIFLSTGRMSLPVAWVPSDGDRFVNFKEQH
jgi:hypothetical protein